MNYLRIYEELMDRALLRNGGDLDLYEIHHVLPKCMGGSNDPDNLVKLTLREHFLAHWLLYKIHRTRAMALALHMMSTVGKRGRGRKLTSRQFAICREAHRRANIGRVHSEATKRKQSEAKLGRKHTDQARENMRRGQLLRAPATEATCRKISEALKGKPKSEQARKALSISAKSRGIRPELTVLAAAKIRKPILAIQEDEVEIVFESIKDAAIFYGTTSTAVSSALRGLTSGLSKVKNVKFIRIGESNDLI